MTRIVIGASGIAQPGWIATEAHELNLLKPADWEARFEEATIDVILAEHVWEHLTCEEGLLAARLCRRFLKRGGYIRAAVPDGLHPDPAYIDYVKPGGTGAGADDHKVLYTFRTFREVFHGADLEVDPIEYFDEYGTFHARAWNAEDGLVRRSRAHDPRNEAGGTAYTSIILDARRTY
jgi:predicted SAM-dependent methyltransferase